MRKLEQSRKAFSISSIQMRKQCNNDKYKIESIHDH